jgi:hypothetical protein
MEFSSCSYQQQYDVSIQDFILDFLHIYCNENYLKQKLNTKMKHTFYAQHNFSASNMVFEMVKQKGFLKARGNKRLHQNFYSLQTFPEFFSTFLECT